MDLAENSGKTAPVIHSSLSSLMQTHLDSAAKKTVSILPDSPDSQPGNGSSLMAFANQFLATQLSKSPSNNFLNPSEGKFVIPNFSNILKGSKNGGLENLVSKLQIKTTPIDIPLLKDNDAQKRHKSDSFEEIQSKNDIAKREKDDWEIDLSDAIIKTSISPVSKLREVKEKKEEIFILPFIDCDVEIKPPIIMSKPLLPCLFYDSDVFVSSRSRKRTSYKNMTTMGKVICMNPKRIRVRDIERKYYDPLDKVEMFKFDCPSPDEVIMENLKHKKIILNRRTFLEP